MTIRAHQKFRRDFVVAHRADLAFLNVLKHGFAREFPLIFFCQGFARAQDHVQQETRQIKDEDERDGKELGKNVT